MLLHWHLAVFSTAAIVGNCLMLSWADGLAGIDAQTYVCLPRERSQWVLMQITVGLCMHRKHSKYPALSHFSWKINFLVFIQRKQILRIQTHLLTNHTYILCYLSCSITELNDPESSLCYMPIGLIYGMVINKAKMHSKYQILSSVSQFVNLKC